MNREFRIQQEVRQITVGRSPHGFVLTTKAGKRSANPSNLTGKYRNQHPLVGDRLRIAMPRGWLVVAMIPGERQSPNV